MNSFCISLSNLFNGVSFLGSLNSSYNLRVKYGIDPSYCSIHLGHLYCFFLLKFIVRFFPNSFIYFVLGDYTVTLCKKITNYYINFYTNSLFSQIKSFFNCYNINFYILRNSCWLKYVTLEFFYGCSSKYLFTRRVLRRTNKFYFGDLVYPYYQNFDNLIISPNLEVGGIDQLFNFSFGLRFLKTKTILFILVPLLMGLNSSYKMSKSSSNCIFINNSVSSLFLDILKSNNSGIFGYLNFFSSFFAPNLGLIFFLKNHNLFLKFKFLIFISRYFYLSTIFPFLREYLSKVFIFNFCSFFIFSDVYLFDLLFFYKIFLSKKNYKIFLSQGSIYVNSSKIKSPFFIIFSNYCYVIFIGRFLKIFINVS